MFGSVVVGRDRRTSGAQEVSGGATMPTTFQLRVWTRFFASPDEVWALKTDPAALADEFRPYFRFSADAEAMRRAFAGALPADIQAKLRPMGLPIGLSWPVHLSEATRPETYTDSSENKLYSRFSHQHRIELTPDGCRYIDHVVFRPRLLSKPVALLTERLFKHRHRVSGARLDSDPQATGVSVLRVLVEEEEQE